MTVDECYAGNLAGYIMDNSPRILPQFFTGIVYFFQPLDRSLFVGSGINGAKILGKIIHVFIGHIFKCVTHRVYDATPMLRVGKRSSNCFFDPGESVRAEVDDLWDVLIILGGFFTCNFVICKSNMRS